MAAELPNSSLSSSVIMIREERADSARNLLRDVGSRAPLQASGGHPNWDRKVEGD